MSIFDHRRAEDYVGNLNLPKPLNFVQLVPSKEFYAFINSFIPACTAKCCNFML